MSHEKLKIFSQTNITKDKSSLLFSSAESGPQKYEDGRTYFHYKADVSRFIDSHWNYFWTKARGETWINSASSALSTNSSGNNLDEGRFESGKAKYNKNGMWALVDSTRIPSSYDISSSQHKTRTAMYNISPQGSLIPISDSKIFSASNLNLLNYNSSTNILSSLSNSKKRRKSENSKSQIKKSKLKSSRVTRTSTRATSSEKNSGAPKSKSSVNINNYNQVVTGNKKYVFEEFNDYINPETEEWSIKMWPDLDNPLSAVMMQSDLTHSAPQMKFSGINNEIVFNDSGYRVSKASHGVVSGTYYYEVEVLKPSKTNGNLRIGFAQISADLQAPCGYDHFSYSMRLNPATRFHASVGNMYGEPLEIGDVLGCLIHLPKLEKEMSSDLNARRWDYKSVYKPFDYKQPKHIKPPTLETKDGEVIVPNIKLEELNLPPLPIVKDSEIVFYKNGKSMGTAFRGLFLGKYYPAISSYMGGKAKVNFGGTTSPFKFEPPCKYNDQPICAFAELSKDFDKTKDKSMDNNKDNFIDSENILKLPKDIIKDKGEEYNSGDNEKIDSEYKNIESNSLPQIHETKGTNIEAEKENTITTSVDLLDTNKTYHEIKMDDVNESKGLAANEGEMDFVNVSKGLAVNEGEMDVVNELKDLICSKNNRELIKDEKKAFSETSEIKSSETNNEVPNLGAAEIKLSECNKIVSSVEATEIKDIETVDLSFTEISKVRSKELKEDFLIVETEAQSNEIVDETPYVEAEKNVPKEQMSEIDRAEVSNFEEIVRAEAGESKSNESKHELGMVESGEVGSTKVFGEAKVGEIFSKEEKEISEPIIEDKGCINDNKEVMKEFTSASSLEGQELLVEEIEKEREVGGLNDTMLVCEVNKEREGVASDILEKEEVCKEGDGEKLVKRVIEWGGVKFS
ncbi:Set1/Ash2 histone methyltransferase complex subunit ASH2 [Smittium culicis]|uniref:Set1/Ash2 histone methyltransferase complex subunit ASH2 n=1 Tax=Smittium culicis TaxID=133412 RepID=A0A1R1X0M0_9FUNG|nr:Set1/Ash2 histone methyltransferase complex subunit ASH2 [Smittium culicis]OMJ15599.1 Set1/Ash2 histone methyltransferase complex subunit ASH2 [Smittium culicis]OMJ18174.1 Set1/Ash2 histone methyltransferase complex subunit ASH2 [Smittium culicis]